ncbi:MAG: hypothetical protein HY738_15195 [Bacteroidia bacterium]|nr:hypothetical protein [Bacteroidia bacterium]
MLTTKELPKPAFVITQSDFTSDDGKNIRVNYPVRLKTSIQNTGKATANEVIVKFSLINDNCVALDKDKIQLGIIKAGEKKEVQFLFTATNQYVMDKVPVKMQIAESTGKSGFDTILVAAFEKEILAEDKTRGGGDPLKGLNVSDAKKEMQL